MDKWQHLLKEEKKEINIKKKEIRFDSDRRLQILIEFLNYSSKEAYQLRISSKEKIIFQIKPEIFFFITSGILNQEYILFDPFFFFSCTWAYKRG